MFGRRPIFESLAINMIFTVMRTDGIPYRVKREGKGSICVMLTNRMQSYLQSEFPGKENAIWGSFVIDFTVILIFYFIFF